jgi:hypothetical protein
MIKDNPELMAALAAMLLFEPVTAQQYKQLAMLPQQLAVKPKYWARAASVKREIVLACPDPWFLSESPQGAIERLAYKGYQGEISLFQVELPISLLTQRQLATLFKAQKYNLTPVQTDLLALQSLCLVPAGRYLASWRQDSVTPKG